MVVQVLAEQHMMKLERLIGSMPEGLRPTAALLTGSAKAKERRAVYAGLADGSINLVLGTHALITDALEFQKLGLAVIDEQHRWVLTSALLKTSITSATHVKESFSNEEDCLMPGQQ